MHNFRCFENFELPVNGLSSVLIIGKNGSGKTTVGLALEIFQKIGRGTNRINQLIKVSDFSRGRTSVPMRFEIDLEIDGKVFSYNLALDLPHDSSGLRVLEEKLSQDGKVLYSRELDSAKTAEEPNRKISYISMFGGAKFSMEAHVVALPIVQDDFKGPITAFTSALRKLLILRPIPTLINGSSNGTNAEPNASLSNLGAWFTELSVSSPSVYSIVESYLKNLMPDFESLSNPLLGQDYRSLEVNFSESGHIISLPFEVLSDGEKVFVITGMVMAAKKVYPQLVCFWDEPDNNMSLAEVELQIVDLRRIFRSKGQLILTSHIDVSIQKFPRENILLLHRKGHFHPTQISFASSLEGVENLVTAFVEGDLPE